MNPNHKKKKILKIYKLDKSFIILKAKIHIKKVKTHMRNRIKDKMKAEEGQIHIHIREMLTSAPEALFKKWQVFLKTCVFNALEIEIFEFFKE